MSEINTSPLSTRNMPLESCVMQKCVFILNALDKGWSVKKRKGSYLFTKKHEGKKEILSDKYLDVFLTENFDSSILFKGKPTVSL
jgi:hypothetical protein